MKIRAEEPAQALGFDSVKTFREIKEKIALEMASMSFGQIKAYLKASSAKLYAK